jgi:hypothetical protein
LLPPSLYAFDIKSNDIVKMTNLAAKNTHDFHERKSRFVDAGSLGYFINVELAETNFRSLRLMPRFGDKTIEILQMNKNSIEFSFNEPTKKLVFINPDLLTYKIVTLAQNAEDPTDIKFSSEIVSPALSERCRLSAAPPVFSADGKFLIGEQFCPGATYSILTSLEVPHQLVSIKSPVQIDWISPQKDFVFFSENVVDANKSYRAITGSMIHLPTHKKFFAPFLKPQEASLKTQDPLKFLRSRMRSISHFPTNNTIVGLTYRNWSMVGQRGKDSLFLVDASTGTLKSICENISLTNSLLIPHNDSRAILISYQLSNQVASIYSVSGDECLFLNELPLSSNGAVVRKVEITERGVFLILSDIALKSRLFDEVIFVPANGSAAMKLNENGIGLKQIESVVQDVKTQTIYIYANTMESKKFHVFKFDLSAN